MEADPYSDGILKSPIVIDNVSARPRPKHDIQGYFFSHYAKHYNNIIFSLYRARV